jgi:hypothetical protein
MKAKNILYSTALAFVISAAFVFSSALSLADEINATEPGTNSSHALKTGEAGSADGMDSYFDKISSLNNVISPSNATSYQATNASYGEDLSSNALSSLTHTPGFSTYNNFTDYGIKIDYPENWSSDEAEMFGLNAVFFFPPQNQSMGQFRDNVSLAYQSLPMAITLDQFAEIFTSEFEQQSPNFGIISTNDTTLGTVPAKEVTYSLRQAQTDLKVRQVYAVKGARAYVITCAADSERFDGLEGMFQKMLKSVELV